MTAMAIGRAACGSTASSPRVRRKNDVPALSTVMSLKESESPGEYPSQAVRLLFGPVYAHRDVAFGPHALIPRFRSLTTARGRTEIARGRRDVASVRGALHRS